MNLNLIIQVSKFFYKSNGENGAIVILVLLSISTLLGQNSLAGAPWHCNQTPVTDVSFGPLIVEDVYRCKYRSVHH